jgi:tyrosinase
MNDSFAEPPIFDSVYGFGVNGAYISNWTGFFGNSTPTNSGGGCIQDGPFNSYNLSVGPGTSVTNHRIVRNFNNNSARWGNSTQVANTIKQPNFEAFRQEAGGGFRPPPNKIHDSGHGMISGEMGTSSQVPAVCLDTLLTDICIRI